MFMRRYKKEMAELSARNETLIRQHRKILDVCRKQESELNALRKELAETRAELARYREAEAAQNSPTPKPRVVKVPHCVGCPDHARFNNAGKYAHQCNKMGRPISGNDTRTSPTWCPLRTAKKDGDTTASTAKNTTEKGSVNHDDSTT